MLLMRTSATSAKLLNDAMAFTVHCCDSAVARHNLDLTRFVQEGRVARDASNVLEEHRLVAGFC